MTITLSGSKPSVTVSGVATDIGSHVTSVHVNGGTTNLLRSGGAWTYTETNLTAGPHTYEATITDQALNQASVTGSVVTIINHNDVVLTGTIGGDTINSFLGNSTITITDTNGGHNTVSTAGGHNQVAITDTAGQDSITLSGGNNQVTIGGSAGGDTISASTNDNFVYTQMLNQYDTIRGVFNSGGNTKDVFDLSAIAGATTYQGGITNGQVSAHSVG
jgi:hypothetical protein